MQLIKELHQLDRIHQLIRTKATGCPQSLARRLQISERQLYRTIEQLKSLGLPVSYCRTRQCYYYPTQVALDMSLSVDGIQLVKIS